MSKEDYVLPVEMQKLEIEPTKTNTNPDVNPFLGRNISSRLKPPISKPRSPLCACSGINRNSKSFIASRQHRPRLLKEPVLQYFHQCCEEGQKANIVKCLRTKQIVCEINNVSKEENNSNYLYEDRNLSNVVELQNRVNSDGAATPTSSNHSGPSCSQQALNPPCDITMDELASYFETMVHIPKKMSSMAEMMYI